MIKNIFTFGIVYLIAFSAFSQELKLSNALIVSHMDKQQDRFSLEIACSEVLAIVQVSRCETIQ